MCIEESLRRMRLPRPRPGRPRPRLLQLPRCPYSAGLTPGGTVRTCALGSLSSSSERIFLVENGCYVQIELKGGALHVRSSSDLRSIIHQNIDAPVNYSAAKSSTKRGSGGTYDGYHEFIPVRRFSVKLGDGVLRVFWFLVLDSNGYFIRILGSVDVRFDDLSTTLEDCLCNDKPILITEQVGRALR